MPTSTTQVRTRRVAPERHLLLAEDDDEVRCALTQIFEADGFTVSAARNGEELVSMLERARDTARIPDIIVTDHRMPGFTGLDVAAALRDARWPVPIIVITACTGDLGPARERGADLVFRKPFDADDLRTAVLYCLESRKPDHVS